MPTAATLRDAGRMVGHYPGIMDVIEYRDVIYQVTGDHVAILARVVS